MRSPHPRKRSTSSAIVCFITPQNCWGTNDSSRSSEFRRVSRWTSSRRFDRRPRNKTPPESGRQGKALDGGPCRDRTYDQEIKRPVSPSLALTHARSDSSKVLWFQ